METVQTTERMVTIEVEMKQMTATLNQVSAKMDAIHELTQNVTRIQEQQIRHNEGLDRAFKTIDLLRTEMSNAIAESEEDRASLRQQVAFWKGALLIGSFVLGSLNTVIWRGYDGYSESVKKMQEFDNSIDKRVSVLETVVKRNGVN